MSNKKGPAAGNGTGANAAQQQGSLSFIQSPVSFDELLATEPALDILLMNAGTTFRAYKRRRRPIPEHVHQRFARKVAELCDWASRHKPGSLVAAPRAYEVITVELRRRLSGTT